MHESSVSHIKSLLSVWFSFLNHGLKSWDKFAFLALLHSRQTWIQLHLPSLSSPHTMLKTTTNNFSWVSTFYRVGRVGRMGRMGRVGRVGEGEEGGEGEQQRVSKTIAALFTNFKTKLRSWIRCTTQVSPRCLFTIVAEPVPFFTFFSFCTLTSTNRKLKVGEQYKKSGSLYESESLTEEFPRVKRQIYANFLRLSTSVVQKTETSWWHWQVQIR